MRSGSDGTRSWTLGLDFALLLLLASVRTGVEHWRGLVHAGSDLTALFTPTFAWWWQTPRWLGGWNPWVMGGFPANADPQYAPLHPLGLLFGLFPPLTAATLEGILAPALTGLGLLLYLRTIDCSRAAALVGACSLALCGYLSGHAAHPVLLRAMVGVPFALAALEGLRGRALGAGLGAAVATILVSGHPQGALYALTPVVAYALFPGRLPKKGSLPWVALGFALAFGMAAPIWLATPELIAASTRASESMSLYTNPSLGWSELTRLIAPYALGGGVGPFQDAAPVTTACGAVECSSYVGTAPWLLILAGSPLLIRDRRGRFWLAAAALGLILSTGVAGAGHPQLRAPVRFLLWLELGIACASAIALDRVLRSPPGSSPISARALALATAALAGAVAVSGLAVANDWRAVLLTLAILAASGIAVLQAARGVRGSGFAVVCVLALDLALFAGSFPFGQSRKAFERAPALPRQLARVVAARGRPNDRVLAVPLLPGVNWAPFTGTQALQGYGSLVPQRLADLIAAEPEQPFGPITLVSDASLARPENRALDLLRTRIVAVARATEVRLAADLAFRAASGSGRWSPIAPAPDGWLLYENRRALPVAWLVHRVRVTDKAGALDLIRGVGGGAPFDPRQEALASAEIAGLESPEPDASESAHVETYGEDEVRLTVRAAAPALLVTSDAADPGWTVLVDERPAVLQRVNASFRAVVVPAGESQVSFRYEPVRWRVGLAIGGMSLLGVTALAALSVLSSASTRPTPRRRD